MIETDGTPEGAPQYVTQAAFDKTAAMIGRLLKGVEALTSTALTAEKLVELGLVEKDAAGVLKAKAAEAPKPEAKVEDKPDPRMTQMEARLAAMAAEAKTKDEAIAAADVARGIQDRNQAARAALAKANGVNPDRDYIHVADKLVKNEAGEWVLPSKDQYGVDIFTPIAAIAEKYLKDNPELARATVTTGTGTTPGQLMSPDQAKAEMKEAFVAAGYHNTGKRELKVLQTNVQ